MYANIVPSMITATHEVTIINSQVSSRPCPVSSINSIPGCTRGPDADSHINAAKHGSDSLAVSEATNALLGNRNAGNGGGGIDKMESGGGPNSKHCGPHIFRLM